MLLAGTVNLLIVILVGVGKRAHQMSEKGKANEAGHRSRSALLGRGNVGERGDCAAGTLIHGRGLDEHRARGEEAGKERELGGDHSRYLKWDEKLRAMCGRWGKGRSVVHLASSPFEVFGAVLPG